MVSAELDVGTVLLKSSVISVLFVHRSLELGESPLLGNEDLLTSGVLELGSAQGFNNGSPVLVVGSDAHDGLTDVYSCNCTLGFTEGTSHSSLEPISSGTRQHFVDADHMEGMDTHPDVEGILTAVLHQVFVGANTASFKSFG